MYMNYIWCFLGYYDCLCPALWNGVTCETFDPTFTGGTGQKVTPAPTTPKPLSEQEKECEANRCAEKAYNGQCDVSLDLL